MPRVPLKVLWVLPFYEGALVYGGPARSLPLLCRALVGQGVQVSVLATNANGRHVLDVPLGRPLDSGGVEVTYYRRLTAARFAWSPGLALACVRRCVEFDLVLYQDVGGIRIPIYDFVTTTLPGSVTSSSPYFLTRAGDNLYFSADDGSTGRELWRVQGAAAERVADLAPGSAGGSTADTMSPPSDQRTKPREATGPRRKVKVDPVRLETGLCSQAEIGQQSFQ